MYYVVGAVPLLPTTRTTQTMIDCQKERKRSVVVGTQ